MKSVEVIMESLDGDELCKYCKYNIDCNGGVIGAPNGPIYPPCADGLDESDFDLDSYLGDKKED